jgi:hypothetical protein
LGSLFSLSPLFLLPGASFSGFQPYPPGSLSLSFFLSWRRPSSWCRRGRLRRRRAGRARPGTGRAAGWRRRVRACTSAGGASGSRQPGELAQAGGAQLRLGRAGLARAGGASVGDCGGSAQEAGGAGSAGAAQARMQSARGSRRCRWSRGAAAARAGERRQRGGRLRLASGGARAGDGVRRALAWVNGRGAGVIEQARDLAAQTWVSPSHGTGRTCRAARPSAVVGQAENRAGTCGAEEREGPTAERGGEHAGHRVGAAGVGLRRTDVVTVHRRACAGGAAIRRLEGALLVKDLEVARRRAMKRRWQPDATSLEEPRCSQAQRAPSTHAEVDAELTTDSVRFCKRVRMQGNRPRACRLGAVGVGAEQKQRTGDAIRHGGLAGSYASVPAVSQRHTRVSSGGLACEQENPEVRKGVSIANQSGSIILSHGPQHPATTIPCRSSEQDHNTSRKLVNPLIELLRSLYAETSSPWQSQLLSPRATVRSTPDHLPPTATLPGKLLRHPRNLVTVEHFLSLILFATGVHFPSVLLYNQGYPKVCPDSLNLPNTGDPFC